MRAADKLRSGSALHCRLGNNGGRRNTNGFGAYQWLYTERVSEENAREREDEVGRKQRDWSRSLKIHVAGWVMGEYHPSDHPVTEQHGQRHEWTPTHEETQGKG
ncbi:hypothetical protein chiPu_0002040 [Chiloscyllium punctatum]|uniref:Uncharacterized protein n=1 Tax=Chiloscyllium punctatum TaxID=137246 RepID=A0A401RZR8_CHIPU|nr:hypothetical protein [Chiloscyllium punctatum]